MQPSRSMIFLVIIGTQSYFYTTNYITEMMTLFNLLKN